MNRNASVRSLLLAILLLFEAPLFAQAPLEGAWTGRWIRDGSALQVTMRFAKSDNGYVGSFDSEQLRVIGIPLKEIVFDPPTVGWRIVGDASTTKFHGRLQGKGIEGNFQEGDATGTFTLLRALNPAPLSKREDITFNNGEVRLAGTIFVPVGNGPHPGIVFMHGSGAEGRWASNYLAEKFSQRGIAALVFDKRGVGESGGDWQKVGFDELANDAAVAVAALRAKPYVARNSVGIYGHSQGGTIAPLAALRIGAPAFVIASAASGLPMRETEVYSLENSVGVQEMDSSDAAAAREYVRLVVAIAYDGQPRERLMAAWRNVRTKPWAFEPPAETDNYWSFSRRVAAYDAIPLWRQVTAPTLLVYGEADERVPPRASASRIAEACLDGNGKSLAIMFFPQADHSFRLSAPAVSGFSWPRTAPGYPDSLIDWTLRVVGPESAGAK